MAIGNDKGQQIKSYYYRRCPTCDIKLHLYSYICWKCNKRVNYDANKDKWVEEIIYESSDPNDAIYSRMLNDVEKCFVCRNTQGGNSCKKAICYGIGRGKCDQCNRFESVRFMCCQNVQEEERKADTEKIKEMIADSTKPYLKEAV